MFEVMQIDSLPAIAWKNGGGITREIAKSEIGGALVWRISVADVGRDGPFSHFAGLMRCLTVVQGAGIDLLTPENTIRARLGEPVRFFGEMPVTGRLINGPIRDLNVIFDPLLVSAEVMGFSGPAPFVQGPAPIGEVLTGLIVMAGNVTIDRVTLPPGAFAFGTFGTIDPGPDSAGVVVTLHIRL